MMNDENIIPFSRRVAAARAEGDACGQAALEKVEQQEQPTFGERALAYIKRRMLNAANDASFTIRGEQLVDEAKAAGIDPGEDRAFGPVFARAIRERIIKSVGFVPREKGRGTAGGRVYAPGDREDGQ